MTDLPTAPPAPDLPVYELPELPQLDARSAVAMALLEELDRQMSAYPDATVVLDPRGLADAALAVVDNGRFPTIPTWLGEPRSIGGGVRAGDTRPEALITMSVEPGSGRVTYSVEAEHDDGIDNVEELHVPAADARVWHLAGLAACVEAENPVRSVSPPEGG